MTTATTTRTAAGVTYAVKVYGAGDTGVLALDGVTVAFPAGSRTVRNTPARQGRTSSARASLRLSASLLRVQGRRGPRPAGRAARLDVLRAIATKRTRWPRAAPSALPRT
ncbi:hypothetical protein [Streptomyces bobili]|uniref:hypothetical protein n=1 Tax=Streptomyces bobili TaxID=67280 RepID=UPI003F53F03F